MAAGPIIENGFDESRFEHPVSENFKCSICLNVLNNPKSCRNNQHYFCSGCILRHLEKRHTCPECNEELTPETLVATPRVLRNCISELLIKCKYSDRGCSDRVQVGNLQRHVDQCGFAPVRCRNDGCDMEISARDRIHHETELCEFRRVLDIAELCGELTKDIVKLGEQQIQLNKNQEIKLDKVTARLENIEKDVTKAKELHLANQGEIAVVVDEIKEVKNFMNDVLLKVNDIHTVVCQMQKAEKQKSQHSCQDLRRSESQPNSSVQEVLLQQTTSNASDLNTSSDRKSNEELSSDADDIHDVCSAKLELCGTEECFLSDQVEVSQGLHLRQLVVDGDSTDDSNVSDTSISIDEKIEASMNEESTGNMISKDLDETDELQPHSTSCLIYENDQDETESDVQTRESPQKGSLYRELIQYQILHGDCLETLTGNSRAEQGESSDYQRESGNGFAVGNSQHQVETLCENPVQTCPRQSDKYEDCLESRAVSASLKDQVQEMEEEDKDLKDEQNFLSNATGQLDLSKITTDHLYSSPKVLSHKPTGASASKAGFSRENVSEKIAAFDMNTSFNRNENVSDLNEEATFTSFSSIQASSSASNTAFSRENVGENVAASDLNTSLHRKANLSICKEEATLESYPSTQASSNASNTVFSPQNSKNEAALDKFFDRKANISNSVEEVTRASYWNRPTGSSASSTVLLPINNKNEADLNTSFDSNASLTDSNAGATHASYSNSEASSCASSTAISQEISGNELPAADLNTFFAETTHASYSTGHSSSRSKFRSRKKEKKKKKSARIEKNDKETG